MLITPQKLAVKYSPPRICLIYAMNSESFYHEFPLSPEDLKLSTKKLYKKLHIMNPGYLDCVDSEQVLTLIDMIKQNSHKKSKADRFRGTVENYRQDPEKVPSPKKKVNAVEEVDLLEL